MGQKRSGPERNRDRPKFVSEAIKNQRVSGTSAFNSWASSRSKTDETDVKVPFMTRFVSCPLLVKKFCWVVIHFSLVVLISFWCKRFLAESEILAKVPLLDLPEDLVCVQCKIVNLLLAEQFCPFAPKIRRKCNAAQSVSLSGFRDRQKI